MGRNTTAAVSVGVFAVALVLGGASATHAATPASPKANTFTTMTGCLHAEGDRFLLTEVKGEHAATRRSWKRGFLKKSTKDIQVVSAMSNLKLKDHVGHQVSVVGLKDGETGLRARKLEMVAKTCQ